MFCSQRLHVIKMGRFGFGFVDAPVLVSSNYAPGIESTGMISTLVAGKDRKVRVIFEHFGCFFGRRWPHDRERDERVAGVFDAGRGNLLRLAERAAHRDDVGLVFFRPGMPGGDPFLFPLVSVRLRQCQPGAHFGASFAVEEYSEIGAGWVHNACTTVVRAEVGCILASSRPSPC
jgi:hypothetical protein